MRKYSGALIEQLAANIQGMGMRSAPYERSHDIVFILSQQEPFIVDDVIILNWLKLMIMIIILYEDLCNFIGNHLHYQLLQLDFG